MIFFSILEKHHPTHVIAHGALWWKSHIPTVYSCKLPFETRFLPCRFDRARRTEKAAAVRDRWESSWRTSDCWQSDVQKWWFRWARALGNNSLHARILTFWDAGVTTWGTLIWPKCRMVSCQNLLFCQISSVIPPHPPKIGSLLNRNHHALTRSELIFGGCGGNELHI